MNNIWAETFRENNRFAVVIIISLRNVLPVSRKRVSITPLPNLAIVNAREVVKHV